MQHYGSKKNCPQTPLTLGVGQNSIFSSPEPKALGELIGWDSSRRRLVRPLVCQFTLSDKNISVTSWLIVIKLHLNHHFGWGFGSIRFWARSDQNSGFHGNR